MAVASAHKSKKIKVLPLVTISGSDFHQITAAREKNRRIGFDDLINPGKKGDCSKESHKREHVNYSVQNGGCNG